MIILSFFLILELFDRWLKFEKVDWFIVYNFYINYWSYLKMFRSKLTYAFNCHVHLTCKTFPSVPPKKKLVKPHRFISKSLLEIRGLELGQTQKESLKKGWPEKLMTGKSIRAECWHIVTTIQLSNVFNFFNTNSTKRKEKENLFQHKLTLL